MITRIKRSFMNYSDSKFIDFSQGIILSMTKNVFFPDAAKQLAMFVTTFDKFVASIPPRNLRNMANTAVKKENRIAANNALFIFSLYVEWKAAMDIAALQSTGFILTAKAQAKGLVALVKNVSAATNGIEGMVIVKCDNDPNADIYEVRISRDEKNWEWFGAHRSRTIKVMGLPRSEKLYMQMRIGNSHGYSPWSASISGIIGQPETILSIHE